MQSASVYITKFESANVWEWRSSAFCLHHSKQAWECKRSQRTFSDVITWLHASWQLSDRKRLRMQTFSVLAIMISNKLKMLKDTTENSSNDDLQRWRNHLVQKCWECWQTQQTNLLRTMVPHAMAPYAVVPVCDGSMIAIYAMILYTMALHAMVLYAMVLYAMALCTYLSKADDAEICSIRRTTWRACFLTASSLPTLETQPPKALASSICVIRSSTFCTVRLLLCMLAALLAHAINARHSLQEYKEIILLRDCRLKENMSDCCTAKWQSVRVAW